MKGSRWPLFLARRYFWASRRGRNIASSVLSVLQMCLGTALLIVVIGVMNGFQSGFIQSILEAGTYHVRVGFQDASREEAEALLRENPLVASVTGFMDVQVLASGSYGSSQAVNLRLVDEDAFKRDPALADSLGLDATASFAGKGASLILGGELASSIGASAGEQVEILSVRMDDELGAIPERMPFTVSGTFKTKKKYYEYDRLWAFAPLWTAESLGEGGKQPFLGVKLKDPNKDGEFKRELERDARTA
jgi:lipoprotein-releasing system permease protein